MVDCGYEAGLEKDLSVSINWNLADGSKDVPIILK